MMNNILFSTEGHIATITLNRPEKLNAVTPEMADAIIAHVQQCNADEQIRAVIITGAGERAFCAGSDIAELDTYDTPWVFRNRPDYCDAVRALRKPAICAINGYAFGGGLETAMSCDIRIASDTARFASPEVKLGWIGGGGMAYMLAHNIGASNAARMLMTGEPVSAPTALAWGLVSEVVPSEELLPLALPSRCKRQKPIYAQPTPCRWKPPSSMSATCRPFALPPRMPTRGAAHSRRSVHLSSRGANGLRSPDIVMMLLHTNKNMS
jgi:enoyl-CoA hydratase